MVGSDSRLISSFEGTSYRDQSVGFRGASCPAKKLLTQTEDQRLKNRSGKGTFSFQSTQKKANDM